MALPAKRIPKSIAHLDVEIVAAALIRNDANVRNAARALGVPSGDLRKLVLVDQRLADAALEAVELRLDDAEANLSEALRCGDPRRRDSVSMFMLRNVQRAAKRGYAVAASAASLEVNVDAPPVRYTVRWMNERDSKSCPESEADELERDGQTIAVPRYGGDADPGEGMLATPPALIEAPFVEPEAPSPVEVRSFAAATAQVAGAWRAAATGGAFVSALAAAAATSTAADAKFGVSSSAGAVATDVSGWIQVRRAAGLAHTPLRSASVH